MGAAQERFGEIAPRFAELTDDLLYGEVWSDPALSLRDRSLITVASLISLYRTDQIRGHLARALANGVTPAELTSAVSHLAFYAGWPAAVTAMTQLKELLGQADQQTMG